MRCDIWYMLWRVYRRKYNKRRFILSNKDMPARNAESLKWLNGIGRKKKAKQWLYKTWQAREKAWQQLTQSMEAKRLSWHIVELDKRFWKFIRNRDKKKRLYNNKSTYV